MPTLILFAASERVIVSQSDNTVSLIALLTNVGISVPSDESVPPNARAPLSWAILAVWAPQEEDSGQTFVQRIHLEPPGGEGTSRTTDSEFEMGTSLHRNIVQITGFPVDRQGTYHLRIQLKRKDQGDSEFSEKASFPILVEHRLVERAQE